MRYQCFTLESDLRGWPPEHVPSALFSRLCFFSFGLFNQRLSLHHSAVNTSGKYKKIKAYNVKINRNRGQKLF